MVMAEAAQLVGQLPMAVQQLQPIAEQAVNNLQAPLIQLLAAAMFTVGCVRVRLQSHAVDILKGANPEIPDKAKKLGSKKAGANLGEDPATGGAFKRIHVCDQRESDGVDGNGWMYKLVSTGKSRVVDSRIADAEVYGEQP